MPIIPISPYPDPYNDKSIYEAPIRLVAARPAEVKVYMEVRLLKKPYDISCRNIECSVSKVGQPADAVHKGKP